jgi:hypothetical protein
VTLVAKELAEARRVVAEGRAKEGEAYVQAIHERFTWRMHDLSQFMQGFLQRSLGSVPAVSHLFL